MQLYTSETLADKLNIDEKSLRRALNRKGIYTNEIGSEELKEILPPYTKVRKGRSSSTVNMAIEMLNNLTSDSLKEMTIVEQEIEIEEETVDSLKENDTRQHSDYVILEASKEQTVEVLNEIKSLKETTEIEQDFESDNTAATIEVFKAEKTVDSLKRNEEIETAEEQRTFFFSKDAFLFVVFVAALLWQMHHSAGLVMRISLIEIAWMKWLSGVLFSFAVQFTALLMTIRKGSKNYLMIFACAEVIINMLYYRPWNYSGNDIATYWATSIIVSLCIAFTIYSYSELFVIEKK